MNLHSQAVTFSWHCSENRQATYADESDSEVLVGVTPLESRDGLLGMIDGARRGDRFAREPRHRGAAGDWHTHRPYGSSLIPVRYGEANPIR